MRITGGTAISGRPFQGSCTTRPGLAKSLDTHSWLVHRTSVQKPPFPPAAMILGPLAMCAVLLCAVLYAGCVTPAMMYQQIHADDREVKKIKIVKGRVAVLRCARRAGRRRIVTRHRARRAKAHDDEDDDVQGLPPAWVMAATWDSYFLHDSHNKLSPSLTGDPVWWHHQGSTGWWHHPLLLLCLMCRWRTRRCLGAHWPMCAGGMKRMGCTVSPTQPMKKEQHDDDENENEAYGLDPSSTSTSSEGMQEIAKEPKTDKNLRKNLQWMLQQSVIPAADNRRSGAEPEGDRYVHDTTARGSKEHGPQDNIQAEAPPIHPALVTIHVLDNDGNWLRAGNVDPNSEIRELFDSGVEDPNSTILHADRQLDHHDTWTRQCGTSSGYIVVQLRPPPADVPPLENTAPTRGLRVVLRSWPKGRKDYRIYIDADKTVEDLRQTGLCPRFKTRSHHFPAVPGWPLAG